MAIRYVSDLHTRLATTNIENEKLLDGMHEGLLILSKNDRKAMFCNKPAQKLIKAFLGTDGNLVEERDLKKTVFETVKVVISMNRDSGSRQSMNQRTQIELLSLEEIIIL